MKQFRATLHREGAHVTFLVHAMPEEWRGRCHSGYRIGAHSGFRARNGLKVKSLAMPELCTTTIFLRGSERCFDDRPARRWYDTEEEAVVAFYGFDEALTQFIFAVEKAAGRGLRAQVQYRGAGFMPGAWRLALYTIEAV